MNVLITHECSGRISEAFRTKGHNAYSCDLVDAEDSSPYHIKGDAFDAIRSGEWDLVISHPVCRYIANSGALRLYIKGKKKNGPDLDRWSMMDGAEHFRRLFFIGSHKGMLCVENPVMHGHATDIIEGPGPLDGVIKQTIQPFDFGEDASKATVLWLRGLPKLLATKRIEPRIVNGRPRWGNQTDSGQNKLAPSPHRSADRARTYQGIANAMADQWGSLK